MRRALEAFACLVIVLAAVVCGPAFASVGRRWMTALLLLLTPALMAPTCTLPEEQAATATLSLPVLVCDTIGTPLGVAPATPGDWLFVCALYVREYGCGMCAPLSTFEGNLLSVPPIPLVTAIDVAKACFAAATPNQSPNSLSYQRICEPLGVYQPAPGGAPNAIDHDDATGEDDDDDGSE